MGGLFGGGGSGVPKNVQVPAPPPNTMPVSMADPHIWEAFASAQKTAAAKAGKGFAGTVRTTAQGAAMPPVATPTIVGGRL
jgi:hypothetical protein